MGAGLDDRHVSPDHDAIEPSQRHARWKARASGGDGVVLPEVDQAAPVVSPLVEITHENRGHRCRAGENLRMDRTRLLPPADTGQIKVHAAKAQRAIADERLDKDGAARLKRWQVEAGGGRHCHPV